MNQDRDNISVADPGPHDPDDVQYVEMIDDLNGSSGPIATNTVTAYLLDATGTRLSGSLVTLYIPFGMLQLSYGATTAGGSWRGAIGQARYNARRGGLELEWLQPLSQRIRISIGSGCVAANGTLTTTAVGVMDGGQDPSFGTGVMSGSTHFQIANYSSQIGNAGAATTGIVAVWDQSAGHYLVIDAPCKDSSCT